LVIFPFIIFGASLDDTVGPNTPGVRFGREFSYAIYILHFPCLRLVVLGLRSFDAKPDDLKMAVVVGLTAVVMATAYVAVRLVENPIRRWLTRRWLHRSRSGA
jgi:peptidoglycan/LPS O-acetylase OafA/YrhL